MMLYARTMPSRRKLKPRSGPRRKSCRRLGEVPSEAVPVLMIDIWVLAFDNDDFGISSGCVCSPIPSVDWCARSSLVPLPINEILRMEAPIQVSRVRARDYDLDGVSLRKARARSFSIGDANRDRGSSPHPERFESLVSRTERTRLGVNGVRRRTASCALAESRQLDDARPCHRACAQGHHAYYEAEERAMTSRAASAN